MVNFLRNDDIRVELPENHYHIERDFTEDLSKMVTSIVFHDSILPQVLQEIFKSVGSNFPDIKILKESNNKRLLLEGENRKFLVLSLPSKKGERFKFLNMSWKVEGFVSFDKETNTFQFSETLENLKYPLNAIYVIEAETQILIPISQTRVL